VHFAGHSLGGMIGPAYARRYPERVLSLGLYSTAAFRTDDDGVKVRGVVAAMREKGVAPVLETLRDRWFTPDFAARRLDVIERRLNIDTGKDVFLSVFDIYAETEMSPWLDEVTQSCLVLTGENDGGCNPRLNRRIAAALPNSEAARGRRPGCAAGAYVPEEAASGLMCAGARASSARPACRIEDDDLGPKPPSQSLLWRSSSRHCTDY
jgi:pimeloyl-ACP methyl ester carboxylesterase